MMRQVSTDPVLPKIHFGIDPVVMLRLTPKEYANLKETAGKQNISMNEYIRRALFYPSKPPAFDVDSAKQQQDGDTLH